MSVKIMIFQRGRLLCMSGRKSQVASRKSRVDS